MRLHPQIQVYNQSSVLSDVEVAASLLAFKYACDHWFEPHWNATASFHLVTTASPATTGSNVWNAYIKDNSDQAGALGYHFDSNGIPELNVFVKTDQQYGLSWQVTFTHEVFEALADPWCLAAMQDPTLNEFRALEVGDPVEGDQFAGTYNGVKISDFILPGWFTGDAGPYDYFQHCSDALEVLPDGYVSIYKSGQWTQYQNQKGDLVEVVDADQNQRIRVR